MIRPPKSLTAEENSRTMYYHDLNSKVLIMVFVMMFIILVVTILAILKMGGFL